ncbi:hypothetical protein A9Q98_02505 [Thalassotalea sp. 42_200_T64]|nr:hypothetical protein A9Q98_02505 [Thalassotalea sp. 42_200_T64]
MKQKKFETTNLNIGFMPLTDCAPLVVAKEMGIFEKWGLAVNLLKQNSWATLRDKLHSQLLDAAQMLAPMPIASNLGLGCAKTDIITPFVLSRNGNAITLSKQLHQQVLATLVENKVSLPFAAGHLRAVIKHRKLLGNKLKFATVFPHSCHFYQLHSYFINSGIDINDIDIVVIPPANMVSALASGEIDGFCAGGPWNAMSVAQGIGFTGVTSVDIWPDFPEKVLAMKSSFQQQNRQTINALLAALSEACSWLKSVENRFEAALMLTQKKYLDAPVAVIAPSLLGSCLTLQNSEPRLVQGYNSFTRDVSGEQNKPLVQEGLKILEHMTLCEQVSPCEDSRTDSILISGIYREDIYQQAMAELDAKKLVHLKQPVSDKVHQNS